ncbi:DsbE family thiol:disulfide interchange protein [Candidatus Spongiihabitans sp.]|uniref:DsbE family thiol:disulfide interchange protein n=1 Tax=Candidatus Spongiihabitans sp. TaxID=3101308 RepID=UPI003C6FAF77
MFKKTLFPFTVFIVVVGFLAIGLNRNPGEVPSPFIGKPAPEFSLPTLITSEQSQMMSTPYKKDRLFKKDLLGKVWLFNVWASWCVACRDEHPLLVQLSHSGLADIVGLNYKDSVAEARKWLQQFGNPYTVIALDQTGDVGIDYGVYGVPETFVIDKQGIVRLKHIGPLTNDDVQNKIIPLVISLQEEKT